MERRISSHFERVENFAKRRALDSFFLFALVLGAFVRLGLQKAEQFLRRFGENLQNRVESNRRKGFRSKIYALDFSSDFVENGDHLAGLILQFGVGRFDQSGKFFG